MTPYAVRQWRLLPAHSTYAVSCQSQRLRTIGCFCPPNIGTGLLWRPRVRFAPLVQGECGALTAPSAADVSWDQRLLYRLFHCWVRLFRKDGWDDLDRIRETIAGLRDDQKTMEEQRLQNESRAADRAIALRLVALYHWARSTEILAHFMLQGQPTDPFGEIDKHFEAGIEAATASGDAQHEVILRWLHAAGRIMVTNSLWWDYPISQFSNVGIRPLSHEA